MSKNFGAKSTADEVLSGVDLRAKRFLVTGAPKRASRPPS